MKRSLLVLLFLLVSSIATASPVRKKIESYKELRAAGVTFELKKKKDILTISFKISDPWYLEVSHNPFRKTIIRNLANKKTEVDFMLDVSCVKNYTIVIPSPKGEERWVTFTDIVNGFERDPFKPPFPKR